MREVESKDEGRRRRKERIRGLEGSEKSP